MLKKFHSGKIIKILFTKTNKEKMGHFEEGIKHQNLNLGQASLLYIYTPDPLYTEVGPK